MSGVNKDTSMTLLCSNGCGFYGSPSTNNMCSKCFRDHQKLETPAVNVQADETESVQTIESHVCEAKEEVATKAAIHVEPVKVDKTAAEEAAEFETELKTTVAEVEEQVTRKRVQKNTSRCFQCRKKVGLLGFKCQCNYVFCSEHRYSDKHDCDVDWKQRAQEHLSRANPVVKADKVQKI